MYMDLIAVQEVRWDEVVVCQQIIIHFSVDMKMLTGNHHLVTGFFIHKAII
jgi:hypothetical protein